MTPHQQGYLDGLNAAWRIVDALGGEYSAVEDEERWADGHSTALTDACEALAKVGASDSDPEICMLRRRVAELEAQVARVERPLAYPALRAFA